MELTDAVTLAFEVELPATAASDYPTLSSLAAFITNQLTPAGPVAHSKPQAAVTASQQLMKSAHMRTELVGMACVYPGSKSGAVIWHDYNKHI